MDPNQRAEAIKLHDEVVLMSGLASQADLCSSSTDPRHRRTDRVWYGEIPCQKPKRTSRILDALAQIGVSDREVIAVGVALPSRANKNTTIYVASNEVLPESTHQYYRKVLELMRQLALSHHPSRQFVDPLSSSPLKNEDQESAESQDIQMSIHKLIFMHSILHTMKRLTKNKSYYENLDNTALDRISLHLQAFLKAAGRVYWLMERSRIVKELQAGDEPLCRMFVGANLSMIGAYNEMQSERKSNTLLDKFLEKFASKAPNSTAPENGEEQKPQKLHTHERVILKMIKLQQASVRLVMWALSPRRRKYFHRGDFDVEFLSGIQTMSVSESSIAASKDILLRLAGLPHNENMRKFIDEQMAFLSTRLQPYRHAEVRLCHYLTTLKRKNNEFNFCGGIGVSKPSCLGCEEWIDSYNRYYNTAWSISGTRDDLYPWGFFETEDEITEESLSALRMLHAQLRLVFARRCSEKFDSQTRYLRHVHIQVSMKKDLPFSRLRKQT